MILRAEPDIDVVGEAGNGLEAVEETSKLRPDCAPKVMRYSEGMKRRPFLFFCESNDLMRPG